VTVLNSTSSSLNGVYNDKAVGAKLEGYEKTLSSTVAGRNVVGVVVAVNGRIEAADVFGSHQLFETYWPKLLKSYEVEAVSAAGNEPHAIKPPANAAALAFIRPAEGRFSSESRSGVYKLIKRESEASTSFELDYTGSGAPVLVHFNRVVSR
ncbi:MAG: ARPP-1 family domain-containing protein, partial [Blastocatellia bacterium]